MSTTRLKTRKADIRWIDSLSPTDVWIAAEQIKDFVDNTEFVTRGFLVYEDEQWVGVAHSLQFVGGGLVRVGGLIMIPKACVVSQNG